jgi:hypothetical protein
MDLLTEYEKAQQRLINLSDQEANLDNLVKIIEEAYRDKINALEAEKSEKVGGARATRNTKLEVIKGQRETLKEVIERYRRILKLMGLYKDNPTRGSIDNPVKILHEDVHSMFVLRIAQAGRYSRTTVNNFSLHLEGKSIFHNFFSYSDFNFSGVIVIKRAPSEKALIEYMNRPQNLKRIIGMLPMYKLATLEKEYLEAIELLKEVKWQIQYLEFRRHYYEHNVSHGTENPEYKEILKQIQKLKTK